MIFVGYKDNSYRFICYTQGNVIFCSIYVIFEKEYFPRCLSSYPRERRPLSRLIPEIESLAPKPFGINEPALISFSPIPVYPRPSTPPIPPNLLTHSESLSSSPLLILPKQSLIKTKDVEDVKMCSPSLSPPKTGLS